LFVGMAAGLLLRVVGLCFWLVLSFRGSSVAVSATAVAPAPAPGTGCDAVMVDARAAVAETDEAFVCATLDWWPPEKCDYGTCAWGLAGLLNLVLACLTPPLLPSPSVSAIVFWN
jgi:heparanase 1